MQASVRRSVREVKHEAALKQLAESDQLFADTINGNEEAVAAQIEKIHAEETAPAGERKHKCRIMEYDI